MKHFTLALTAVAVVSVVANSASASDRFSAPSHSELAHRSYHRAATHLNAHRAGIGHYQHHQLHQALQHEAVHDRIQHRGIIVFGGYTAPSYGHATPNYRQAQSHGAPVYRSASPSYGRRSSYGHGGHGIRISTPRFSFSFGH